MKKLIMIAGLLLMCLSGRAQSNGTEEFLDRYQALVVMVESEEVISDEEYKVFSAKFEELTGEYHDTYKALMTDDQISKYTELRTRYQKKVLDRTAGKVGEKIDSVGQNVIKGVKKTGSKVSGFLKGIFNKK
ncbi:MAG: hypothetical protein IKZ93_02135 [Prevotella sp.]|nr:hypothetical protein [Prevotella sp.]